MRGTLIDRLLSAAIEHADRPAVQAGSSTQTYAEVWRDALLVTEALRAAGIGPGDRVALWMEKTPLALRALLGVLAAGASYVPIDPKAPWRRGLMIAQDGAVAGLAIDRARAVHLAEIRAQLPSLRLVLLEGEGGLAASVSGADGDAVRADLEGARGALALLDPEEPAYLLYTSGSTGRPKGVVLSHRAALSFVDWCTKTFAPRPDDRMSSHAPFHFDLSTFDLFVTLTSGASVRLLTSTESMLAPWLSRQVATWGLTFWYSVPSVLVQMLELGQLEEHHWPTARVVLFAGEVFPTPPLRRLRRALPHVRLVNLFGPTETNVCTYFEVGQIDESDNRPIPIGRVCENLTSAILDDENRECAPGVEGDLWIGGGNLLTEYRNDPELTAKKLRLDPRPGARGLLYHTGDRVRLEQDGNLTFLGRRDHMVKVRGYRVETGEIESALYDHAGLAEAAVIALKDDEAGYSLAAFLVMKGESPATHDLRDEATWRAHLGERVPLYMVPAEWFFVDALPRTSTGKIDRVALAERARAT